MSACLMGTKPSLKCDHIHFIPNNSKTPNIASNCYFNMWKISKWNSIEKFFWQTVCQIFQKTLFSLGLLILCLWNLGFLLCNLVGLTPKMRVLASTLESVIPRFGHSSWATHNKFDCIYKKYRNEYDLSSSLEQMNYSKLIDISCNYIIL